MLVTVSVTEAEAEGQKAEDMVGGRRRGTNSDVLYCDGRRDTLYEENVRAVSTRQAAKVCQGLLTS